MLSATVTDLAGKVQSILDRLDDGDGGGSTTQLEGRVRALERILADIRKTLGKLGQEKTRTDAQKALRRPWHMLTAEQAEQRWLELHAWVKWLVARNNIGPKDIPNCWYLHGGLVDELEALRWAWLDTNKADAKGIEPIWWRESLQRARGRWPLFNPNGCATSHSESKPRMIDGDQDWDSFLAEELADRPEAPAAKAS